MKRWVLGVVAAAALVPVAPAEASAPLGARAYDATAIAVPFDPQAGSHGSPVPVRLYTTRADVSNPPVGASARAARTDLGLLEQFTPPQALGPAADASTRDRNTAHDAHQQDGAATYTAHADLSPAAAATAVAQSTPGAAASTDRMHSTSTARVSHGVIAATAHTTMSNLAIGPVTMTSATYDAVASTTGRPGGARASGSVTCNGASVAGVPVLVTPDGVQVDATRVPTDQLKQATAAVARAFAASGYFDVRAVQPVAARRPDGSAASVSGGGLQLIGRSDRQSSYFVATTVLSGGVAVALGDALGAGAPAVAPLGGTLPTQPSSALGPPYAAPPGTPAVAPVGQVAPLVLTSHGSDVRLPTTWGGWPVLLAVFAVLGLGRAALWLPVAAPVRRRVDDRLSGIADRYLRG